MNISSSVFFTLQKDSNFSLFYTILLYSLLFFLSFVTIIGNFIVIYAIYIEKRLQTVSNIFIHSLAISDLLVGLFVMPISSIYSVTSNWPFGLVFCQCWLSIDYTASTASIFNLVALSVDRYRSISSPLKYLPIRTRKHAYKNLFFVWFFSLFWVFPITMWHLKNFGHQRVIPPKVCDVEFKSNIYLKLVTALINFYVPATIIIVLCLQIYKKIKNRSLENNKSSKACANSNVFDKTSASSHNLNKKRLDEIKYNKLILLPLEPFVNEAAQTNSREFDDYFFGDINLFVQIPPTNSDSKSTDRKKIFNNAMFLLKEKKAVQQLGVILFGFIVCWLPYFVLFTVVAYCESCINPNVYQASIWLGYLNSSINPFLYALCNENFRYAFKNIARCSYKKGEPFNPKNEKRNSLRRSNAEATYNNNSRKMTSGKSKQQMC